MKRRTKLALIAVGGLAALGTLAGLAVADHGHKGGRHGHGMHHFQMMTERYDGNRDGKLSQEEIDANRTAWHGEFDTDKNAALSLQEFQGLWLKARNEEMVREFQRFDRDGNGQVTLDEYKQPLDNIVARMDRNGDGVLSFEDHERMRGRHRGMMEGPDGDSSAPRQ
jgi:Ca2+-binding EF-hand superfamily protein